jgi:hypothetical protein
MTLTEARAINEISSAVKEFVRKHIDSVHQLELLLLLKRYEERGWQCSELARELYTNAHACEDNLERFVNDGLIRRFEDGGKTYFQYKAGDSDAQVIELIEAYKHYRVRIIDTIFSKSSNSLKNFSDAFRFSKDKEDS